jgi:hypothetical protein
MGVIYIGEGKSMCGKMGWKELPMHKTLDQVLHSPY